MTRVVIDASVLVSAAISPSGPNAQILDLVAANKIRTYVTPVVVEECSACFSTNG